MLLSLDARALYPSLYIERTSSFVSKRVVNSKVKHEDVNHTWATKYVGIFVGKWVDLININAILKVRIQFSKSLTWCCMYIQGCSFVECAKEACKCVIWCVICQSSCQNMNFGWLISKWEQELHLVFLFFYLQFSLLNNYNPSGNWDKGSFYKKN